MPHGGLRSDSRRRTSPRTPRRAGVRHLLVEGEFYPDLEIERGTGAEGEVGAEGDQIAAEIRDEVPVLSRPLLAPVADHHVPPHERAGVRLEPEAVSHRDLGEELVPQLEVVA